MAHYCGCLRAAVNGILPKQDGPAYLLPVVEGALAGFNMSSPELLAKFSDPKNHLPYMSWQGRDLINFLFANPHATNAQIGLHVHLTEGTVKNKLSKLFQKFDVHKRHPMLEELRRRGYRPVEPDDAVAAQGASVSSATVPVAFLLRLWGWHPCDFEAIAPNCCRFPCTIGAFALFFIKLAVG
jgi:hypothetical protein